MTALRHRCRSCGATLSKTLVDFGEMPLANSYLSEQDLAHAEPTYPLHARVCERCFLVQVDAVTTPDAIFSDYAYFSSYSDSWVEHARVFADSARPRFGLNERSQVVEVASNDGYLLQHFLRAGVPVLGIEPARNVAEVANAAGIPTDVRFFGTTTARDLRDGGTEADLLVANNVVAHVPDLNDFVAGLAIVLADEGVLSLEFQHVLRLIEKVEFDTIYHEHFSYFSLMSLQYVLERHGLRVFDVEELPTHGGSLRVLACHVGANHQEMPSLADLRAQERAFGIGRLETYSGFSEKVEQVTQSFREFLYAAKASNEAVVGYGAAAKGNTLLNVTGVQLGDIAYVVDRNPQKQARYLPGSRLPILAPEVVRQTKPEVLLVLAWNWLDEVISQMSYVREWGCRFVVPIPSLRTVE